MDTGTDINMGTDIAMNMDMDIKTGTDIAMNMDIEMNVVMDTGGIAVNMDI